MLMDFGSLVEFNHGLAPLLYNAVSSQEWQEMVRRKSTTDQQANDIGVNPDPADEPISATLCDGIWA